jgi:hypothetical protein
VTLLAFLTLGLSGCPSPGHKGTADGGSHHLRDGGSGPTTDGGAVDGGAPDGGPDAGGPDAGPPIDGSWTQWIPPGTPARDATAVVFDTTRDVTFLFGGCCDTHSNELADSWTWNGTVWTQLAPAVSPPARAGHAMAFDARRGVVVLFGGANRGNDLGDTWEWNGTTWTQAAPANSPTPRSGHAMTYDAQRGVTLLFGGYSASDNADLAETWTWDGTNWTLLAPATSPSPRESVSLAYDSARQVSVLFGGYDDAAGLDLGDTWEWNGSTWTARHPAHVPGVRSAYACAFDATRGVTLVFGGDNSSPTGPLGDLWAWSGTDWGPLSPSTVPDPRSGAAMAFDTARGVAVLFGGLSTAQGGDGSDTWEWNGTSWTVRVPDSSPPAAYGPAMAFDSGRGVHVLYGSATAPGGDASVFTWEWSGERWSQVPSSNSPSEAVNGVMAYDSRRAVTVYYAYETWEWDGRSWTQLSPPVSPAGASNAAMAYDSARGVAVLFGGCCDEQGQDLNQTWEWDGTTWSLAAPPVSPPGRERSALAYDSDRGATVLFGGADMSGAVLDDTWEWNGTTWTAVTPAASPAARASHAMVYDQKRGVTLLFSGQGLNGVALDDTWAWDGSRWIPVANPISPPPRAAFGMDYDSIQGVVVVFGGVADTTGFALNDTWTWAAE